MSIYPSVKQKKKLGPLPLLLTYRCFNFVQSQCNKKEIEKRK